MANRSREQRTLNRAGRINTGFQDHKREDEIPLSFAGGIA